MTQNVIKNPIASGGGGSSSSSGMVLLETKHGGTGGGGLILDTRLSLEYSAFLIEIIADGSCNLTSGFGGSLNTNDIYQNQKPKLNGIDIPKALAGFNLGDIGNTTDIYVSIRISPRANPMWGWIGIMTGANSNGDRITNVATIGSPAFDTIGFTADDTISGRVNVYGLAV